MKENFPLFLPTTPTPSKPTMDEATLIVVSLRNLEAPESLSMKWVSFIELQGLPDKGCPLTPEHVRPLSRLQDSI
jgi:hypothetical protein